MCKHQRTMMMRLDFPESRAVSWDAWQPACRQAGSAGFSPYSSLGLVRQRLPKGGRNGDIARRPGR